MIIKRKIYLNLPKFDTMSFINSAMDEIQIENGASGVNIQQGTVEYGVPKDACPPAQEESVYDVSRFQSHSGDSMGSTSNEYEELPGSSLHYEDTAQVEPMSNNEEVEDKRAPSGESNKYCTKPILLCVGLLIAVLIIAVVVILPLMHIMFDKDSEQEKNSTAVKMQEMTEKPPLNISNEG